MYHTVIDHYPQKKEKEKRNFQFEGQNLGPEVDLFATGSVDFSVGSR